MARKSTKPAAQLKAVSDALVRERQIKNWQKEISDKISTLKKQQDASKRELEEVETILNQDPELTSVAREVMQKALELQGSGDTELSVYNVNYVSAEDKEKLLLKILRDYALQNPSADSMPYRAIRNELVHRFKIDTPSTGLFFRNELKSMTTKGGNKNKAVVLKRGKLGT